MGKNMPPPSSTAGRRKKNAPLIGISVHWIINGLLPEVKYHGLAPSSSIYDIEDLRTRQCYGAIRSKGALAYLRASLVLALNTWRPKGRLKGNEMMQ
mmetsp:Transcript_25501/g.37825  ORF Transcript_25501/g.37825 Transcript_25501/m.37825 type:complete len:97 (-) Transcript_25501:3445-3735(-)